MDHQIILLMLLATVQLLSTTATSCKTNINIDECPKAWIIKNRNGRNVLKVRCHSRLDTNKFRLVLRAFPELCSWPDADTFPCLEVVVKGKTYKMCTKCCENRSCCASNVCKECKESICLGTAPNCDVLKFEPTISPVEVELKDFTCELSETSDETSSSLELFGEKKSWIEALQYCDQLSSSLVEITNQTIWDELKETLVNEIGLQKGIWVGLERSIFGTDIKWQWTSGAKVDQSRWISSFPADRFNNHCGKIVRSNQTENIYLLDANCHDELPFICQDATVMPED